MGNEYDVDVMNKLFEEIRKAELRNDKTSQYTDREMVDIIKKFILKQVKKEMGVE